MSEQLSADTRAHLEELSARARPEMLAEFARGLEEMRSATVAQLAAGEPLEDIPALSSPRAARLLLLAQLAARTSGSVSAPWRILSLALFAQEQEEDACELPPAELFALVCELLEELLSGLSQRERARLSELGSSARLQLVPPPQHAPPSSRVLSHTGGLLS